MLALKAYKHTCNLIDGSSSFAWVSVTKDEESYGCDCGIGILLWLPPLFVGSIM
jgi:hypothetical protein